MPLLLDDLIHQLQELRKLAGINAEVVFFDPKAKSMCDVKQHIDSVKLEKFERIASQEKAEWVRQIILSPRKRDHGSHV